MSTAKTPEERQLKEIVDKIRKLVAEADLSESTPALVATPLPVAVSMEQAAALLSVAPSTLMEYVRSGQLQTFHMGRRRLVRLDTLHDFARDLENDRD